MRRIRIVTALAALSIMTVASAAAQAETNTAPGNPIPLLKILAKPDKAGTKIHGRASGQEDGQDAHGRENQGAAASVGQSKARVADACRR